MPELPEAEVTTRKLRPLIIGKRILNFNRRILNIERRGKAILIHLSGGKILGFHQRMTGKLLIVPRGWKDKHTRFAAKLSSGKDLVFHDVRKFGIVWYGEAKKVMSDQYFKTLGPDALRISLESFREILKGNNPLNPPYFKGETKIKPFLLNQKNLAGIGNIMADEILWRAKIYPKREVRSLNRSEVRNLWKSIKFILNRSIKLGGSSMRDWLHPDGDKGGYFEKRCVYDREGKKCFRCGRKISRKKIAGRSSYYCPSCQALKNK